MRGRSPEEVSMKLLGLVLAAVLIGCVPVASTQGTTQNSWSSGYASTGYGSTYASAGTGVYINGQELSAADKAELENLLEAVVPPGRYFVDAQGNAGVEGQAAVVNLVVLAQQRDAYSGGDR